MYIRFLFLEGTKIPAHSVTGVGPGSADKAGQKGSEHLFVGVEKLIGTRVVMSGYVALSGGAATVILPQNLPGTWSNNFTNTAAALSDYIIVVNAFNNSNATYVSAIAVDGDDNQTFTITGNGSAVVFWSVIRVTNASVSSFPTKF